MSSTCFEPEGSSSGRRFYVRVWYNVFPCKGLNSLVGGKVCSLLEYFVTNTSPRLYPVKQPTTYDR